MSALELPMPNEPLNTKRGLKLGLRTVVASTWLRDGDEGLGALVVALNPSPPYYTVLELEGDSDSEHWAIAWQEDFHNINPTIECYAQWGGDY